MSRVPRLHLISDRDRCSLERFVEVAGVAVRGGVDAVHLRERGLPAGELLGISRRLVVRAGEEATVFINDRLDIALLGGAAGVQLPESGISVRDARTITGDQLLIGCSVHDIDGARGAEVDGADFVIAGHVFATSSKPGQRGRGLAFLSTLCRAVSIPVIAIGGIRPEDVSGVMEAGAYGIAVISGILSADDVHAAAASYRSGVDRYISSSAASELRESR